MPHSIRSVRTALVSLALLGSGCSVAHDPAAPDQPAPWIAHDRVFPSISPVPPAPAGLDGCLGTGGALVEVGWVDNNDQHDHGALLTFGISPSGLLAAAGGDGTLKFWTFDSELLATVDGSALTYGSEVGAVPITDLAFDDAGAIAGDVRGLVQSMGPDGSFFVLGGTSPDVPIVAVAHDPATGRIAHAQRGEVTPLVVRSADGVSDITETIDTIHDLAFTSTGELLVAGASEGGAAIEVRDASEPTLVRALVRLAGSDPITEVATARESDIGAAVSRGYLYVWRGEAAARETPTSEDALSSVDLTPSGAFSFSIGASGALVAHGTADGREVARVGVPAPVQVRVDPTGQRVIVGSSDAILHVFACRMD